MNTTATSTTDFEFSSSDPQSVCRAFVAHLQRFRRQERDVPWQDAPAVFATAAAPYGSREIKSAERLFKWALETLLDTGEIHVERLDGGGNRLVAA